MMQEAELLKARRQSFCAPAPVAGHGSLMKLFGGGPAVGLGRCPSGLMETALG